MKILFDNQVFSWQKFGGISRYFVELMKNFNNVDCILPFTFSNNVYLRNKLQLPDFRGVYRIYGTIDKYSSMLSLKGDYDVFHPTYYDPYFLRYLHKPYVITVHDMIHEKFSNQIKDYTTIEYKRKVITNADKIIAISENTKKDIIDIYGINEDKISLVYHGLTSVSSTNIKPIENIPNNFILFVGQRDGYKNFERFLKAFQVVHEKCPDINLVCTGAKFKESEMHMINVLNLNSVVNQIYVSDNQLLYLYKKAICFVYPSLYEGFGMPILEAFSAGCPVALSNTSCFPEIARNGGLYFNPYEIDSIADAILKISEDSHLRNDLIVKGEEELKRFSWSKAADETLAVYQTLI